MTNDLSKYLLDTSVIVPAVSEWHDHHEAVLTEIVRRQARGQVMILAGHSLAESYSILTRLPRGRRMSPTVALMTLRRFAAQAWLVAALTADDYLALIERCAERGIAGGRIYDAIIATTAIGAGASVLLTFNERDFTGLVPGLEVVVPGA